MILYRSEENQEGGGSSTLSGLTDVQLTSPSDGDCLTYDGSKWVNEAKGIIWKTQTLAAGSTTVTFTNIPTSGNYVADVYTSVAGLDYESIDDSTAGTLVVTYESQSSAVTVYLKLERC